MKASTAVPRALVHLFRCTMLAWLSLSCTLHAQEVKSAPSEESTPMNPKSVRIDWKFTAPPAKVWAAWTQPRAVSQWFGSDPNGKVLNAYLDVRTGGRFKVTFADRDGTQHTASGIYQQVEPEQLLKFSWGWKSEPGIETEISISLLPEGTGTRMQFEHAGLIHSSSHDYESGWRSTFAKIERVVASGM